MASCPLMSSPPPRSSPTAGGLQVGAIDRDVQALDVLQLRGLDLAPPGRAQRGPRLSPEEL